LYFGVYLVYWRLGGTCCLCLQGGELIGLQWIIILRCIAVDFDLELTTFRRDFLPPTT